MIASLTWQVGPSCTETLRRGWRRIVLFGLCFYPRDIEVRLGQLLADRRQLPRSMTPLTTAPEGGTLPFGLRPWRWAEDERTSFRSLQGGLLVAPVLQALILDRFPNEVRRLAPARRGLLRSPPARQPASPLARRQPNGRLLFYSFPPTPQ